MSEMWNVFDMPDEQNEARFNSAMARKGGMKFNLWHGCHKKSEGCLLDGKEVYRASGFIDIIELERKIVQLEDLCDL